MTDLTFLLEYIDVVTLGICLCLGYALKTAKLFDKFGNQYIPVTMMLCGLIIATITHLGSINQIVILSGLISGLASTGFYEMLRNLINKNSTEGE